MAGKEPTGVMICSRADDAVMVTAGTTLQYFCSKCRQRVVMSASGQRVMKEEAMEIVCIPCFKPPIGEADFRISAGSIEEAQKELETARPNTWKNRN